MGSLKWGYKSPSMGYKYSCPTYNPYTFSFIVGNIIPKSVECIHSATKKSNAE